MSELHAAACMGELLPVHGELTIYTAAEWKAKLVAALAGGRPVTLDLSGVTEIDTAGIQLLLQARRSGARRGLAVSQRAPSAAVAEAWSLLELGPYPEDHEHV